MAWETLLQKIYSFSVTVRNIVLWAGKICWATHFNLYSPNIGFGKDKFSRQCFKKISQTLWSSTGMIVHYSLSIEPSVEGPAIKITKYMVAEAVLKIKEGKACGLRTSVIEMVKVGGDAVLDVITDMINLVIKEEQIHDDRDHSTVINCFKGSGSY